MVDSAMDAVIPTTMFDCFERNRRQCSSNRALILRDTPLTYGRLQERVLRLAGLFGQAGLALGDRVILATRNDDFLVEIFLGLLGCGITAVVMDPSVKAERFHALCDEVRPQRIILDSGLSRVWDVSGGNILFEIDDSPKPKPTLFSKLLGRPSDNSEKSVTAYPHLLNTVSPAQLSVQIPGETIAYVLFTSGTTGGSKGVQISHRALFAHLATLARQFGYNRESRILNVLPMHHADGLIQGPVAAFVLGASVVRPQTFEIQHMEALMDSVYTHRVTHFTAVPTLLAILDRFADRFPDAFSTREFRFIISAASTLDSNLWRRLEERFHTRVVNMYGLTETVTGGLFAGPEDETRRIGTVGRPVDCEVRIFNDDGQPVPSGEIGELWIRGELLMSGYLSEADTRAVMQDGWFRTGDLFRVGADGMYILCGRKKDLIIRGGVNIHPAEVTSVLLMMENIAEAVTFGEPDDIFGEKVIACVVVKDGLSLNVADIVRHCRDRLEEEKVPSKIHIVTSIPKTDSGKPIVMELRTRLAAAQPTSDADEGADVFLAVRQIAGMVFRQDTARLDGSRPARDIDGWDSLAHLEFVAALEQHFQIGFSTAEIIGIDCLSDAVRIIEGKRVS